MPSASLPQSLHTLTFDCWQTLLYEVRAPDAPSGRVDILVNTTGRDRAQIEAALAAAWRRHQVAWHHGIVVDGPQMTRLALDALGVTLGASAMSDLITRLEDEILIHDVRAVDGARDLLRALRGRGVRVALICDTGFSPGRVVRQLLDRVGLLEFLETCVFSNEIGVPKPDVRAFTSALSALGVSATGAFHVGDIRRSDIAGARAAGMGSVRFNGRHDDSAARFGAQAGVVDCDVAGCAPACARPEADFVVASYPALAALLG